MAVISMNETTTFRWSFEEDVFAYAGVGIMAMGVWRQKLSDFGEAKGIELLEETGMAVSHLLWAGGFTGTDGRSYKDAVKDAREAVATAAALKAGCLVVHSGGRGGHTESHAHRLIRGALEELLPLAEELDVVLAIEPMHPGCASGWTFLTNIDDTLALLEEVASPRVKIVFDTYHLGFTSGGFEPGGYEPDIIERIPEIAPHLAIVQLGDGRRPPHGDQNRCLLGQGTVPLGPIVEALTAAGYDGYYDVELLGEDIEGIAYAELLEHAKAAFEELMCHACH